MMLKTVLEVLSMYGMQLMNISRVGWKSYTLTLTPLKLSSCSVISSTTSTSSSVRGSEGEERAREREEEMLSMFNGERSVCSSEIYAVHSMYNMHGSE